MISVDAVNFREYDVRMDDVQLTLKHTKTDVLLKGYVSHGVATAYQQQLFKGVKANLKDMQPTKEDLVDEFGEDKIRQLDELPEDEYNVQFKQLSGEYAMRKMQMDEIGLHNVELANVILVTGLVKLWNGKEFLTEELEEKVNNLPEPDYQQLLAKASEIQKSPLAEPTSMDSGDS